MKSSVRIILAGLPVEQKAKLVKMMEALESVPGELEFDRQVPSADSLFTVRAKNNNPGDSFMITPRLIEDYHNRDSYGEILVSTIEKLLPPGTIISPEPSINMGNAGELFDKLLKAFKIIG